MQVGRVTWARETLADGVQIVPDRLVGDQQPQQS